MKMLLELFLSKGFCQPLIEDYQAKLDNAQYQEVLFAYPNQLTLASLLTWFEKQNDIVSLQEELSSIKKDVLYHSFTHGINHNERVLFFSYYLSRQCQLKRDSMRIVLDAAKYHDIGRVNDLLDPKHGGRSASMIEDVVDDSIYQIEENLNVLRGIVELHSLNDKQVNQIIKKYNIQDKELFYVLFSILKDADALDRIRLTYMKNRFSALNPQYLRLPYSKELLRVAHELHEFYEKNKELIQGGEYEKRIY